MEDLIDLFQFHHCILSLSVSQSASQSLIVCGCRISLFLPPSLARRLLPPGLPPTPPGGERHHQSEGEVRRELREPLRPGGRGVRGEVLEVSDNLQETPECFILQRE